MKHIVIKFMVKMNIDQKHNNKMKENNNRKKKTLNSKNYSLGTPVEWLNLHHFCPLKKKEKKD